MVIFRWVPKQIQNTKKVKYNLKKALHQMKPPFVGFIVRKKEINMISSSQTEFIDIIKT